MTYHIRMSDGLRIDVRAPSAAEAMQSALEKHVGFTVVDCYAGTEIGRNAGVIRFEIPKHEALTAAPEKNKRVKKAERTEKAAPWIEEFLATKQNEITHTD